jgi:predicted transcriptional regulator
MKEYEIRAHLPGQIERFLNCLTQGSEAQTQIEASIEIIKALLQDNKFNKGLDDYKNQLEKTVDQLEKNTIKKIKSDPQIDTIEKVMQELNSSITKVDEVNAEYMTTLQTYILGFISRLGENAGSEE